MVWQLQEAKNKLSELVQQAQASGPQTITVHGKEAVVVVAVDDYRKLTRRGSLVSFLKRSPLAKANLEIERAKDTGRDVDL